MKNERTKFLIQGIALIIFGMLFIFNPIVKMAIFTLVVGVLFVVAGVVALFDGLFLTKGLKYKLFRILEGILLTAFGLIFFIKNPTSGALLIVYFVIWTMIFLAVMNTAMISSHSGGIRWFAMILNLIVIILGIQALFDPQLAVVIFYWSVSFQLIFMGINHISLYFLLPDGNLE